MKEVGALWWQHKGKGMTGGSMGAMSGGSAKPKPTRRKGPVPVRPIGAPAGRGNTAYMPGTLAGAGLTPANEVIGGSLSAGFGDDVTASEKPRAWSSNLNRSFHFNFSFEYCVLMHAIKT